MNKRILLIFAHPALEKSQVNIHLLRAAEDLEQVTVNDLYQEYPDFLIDVEREHRLLETHDVIIFQHPFYWYSAPALLKEWQDLVLEYGYAYGEGAHALKGKWLMTTTSTGGTERAYCASGSNHYTMEELLRPFHQTAEFCGMEYLPPFVVHNTLELASKQQLLQHAQDYQELLTGVIQGSITPEDCRDLHRINADVAALLKHSEAGGTDHAR